MHGKNLCHAAAVALPKCTSCPPKGQELLTCWCEWTLPPALHASVQCALIVWQAVGSVFGALGRPIGKDSAGGMMTG